MRFRRQLSTNEAQVIASHPSRLCMPMFYPPHTCPCSAWTFPFALARRLDCRTPKLDRPRRSSPIRFELPGEDCTAILHSHMKQFTPEAKHAILLEYVPRSPTHSFVALAERHGVPGGESTVRGWFKRWNGTMQSLRPQPRPGRPPLMTPQQVDELIRAPLEEKNKVHDPIS
jgi:transposase-like protein